jgi:hypothetical protein
VPKAAVRKKQVSSCRERVRAIRWTTSTRRGPGLLPGQRHGGLGSLAPRGRARIVAQTTLPSALRT